MSQMDIVTQQNAANATKGAQAAEEINQLAETIETIARQLNWVVNCSDTETTVSAQDTSASPADPVSADAFGASA